MPHPAKSGIDRARKLLRLAQSSNPHEAARAKENAAALMEKHGLSERDLEEVEVEIADGEREPFRDELAKMIAGSMQCEVVVGKRGGLGFRGRRSDIRDARKVYLRLSRLADERSFLSGAPPEAAVELWRICWWLGFLTVLGERLRYGRVLRRELRSTADEQAPVIRAGLQACQELEGELAYEVEDAGAVIERLRDRAYDAGRSAGEDADIGRATVAGLL
jgi:hypothetical protein